MDTNQQQFEDLKERFEDEGLTIFEEMSEPKAEFWISVFFQNKETSQRLQELFYPIETNELYQRQSSWSHKNWHTNRLLTTEARRFLKEWGYL
jgi:hypothetical protein